MNTTQLDTTLRKTARLAFLVEGARVKARFFALLIVAVLAAIGFDAVLGLRPAGLVTVNVALAALAAAGLIYIAIHLLKQTYDRRRIARLIEDRLQLKGSELINAVELADAPADQTSVPLREAAIARGTQLAASLAPSRIVDRGPMKKALYGFIAALTVASIAYLAMPGVFQTVVARYLDPYGDLPPFTLVNFAFEHPAEVYEGKPVTIKVTLSGQNLPDQANIVFVDETSEAATAVPMLRVGGERHEGTEARRHEGQNPTPETRNPKPDGLEFVLPIEKAERTRVFYVNTAAGRSERRTLTVLPVPRFEQVTITYDPPAYTGWKRAVEHLSAQGIRGLEGTKVRLTVTSNLPLRESKVLMEFPPATDAKGQPIKPEGLVPGRLSVDTVTPISGPFPLIPDSADPKKASAELTLYTSATFTLSLIAANKDNTPSLEPLAGKITVLPDKAPMVRITEPGDRQIIAPEGWKVPVTIEAEDDVKIERLTLFRGVNSFSPSAFNLPLADKGPRIAQGKYEFDLGALGAKAGDAIMFFASAQDNFPGLPGGHSVDTETYVIHVISMEEYLTQARSQYRMDEILQEIERFDRLLKELDDRREKLAAEAEALKKKIEEQGGQPTPEDQKKIEELNAKLAEYAEAQWKLGKEMRERSEQPTLYDFEKAYAQMLAEQADNLDRGAEDATKLKRENEFNQKQNPNDKKEAGRHMKQMAEQLKRDGERLDEAQQQAKNAQGDMKLIEKADQIMSQAERLQYIIQQQRDLADRMAQFKNKEKLTPAEQLRAQRLAQEQQELKDELADTLKEMEAAAKAAETDLPQMAEATREIVQSIKELQVERDQSDAERLAKAGEGRYAHTSADSAARKLESLLGQCEGMSQQGEQEFADKKFRLQKQSIGQGLQQLSQGRGLPSLGEGKSGQPGKAGSAGAKGSRGKFSVYGPHAQGKDGGDRRGGKDGTGKGGIANSNSDSASGAERLSPDTAGNRGAGAAAIPGVPTRYRDLAEQYFRRLADEAK
jgi:hypothetical protein